MTLVTSTELRAAAVREVEDLGPEPADGPARALWLHERVGIVVFLASIAGYDATLLRQASRGPAGTITAAASALLLEASAECQDLSVGAERVSPEAADGGACLPGFGLP